MFGEGSDSVPIALIKWSYIKTVGNLLARGCVAGNKRGGAADVSGMLRHDLSQFLCYSFCFHPVSKILWLISGCPGRESNQAGDDAYYVARWRSFRSSLE